MSTYYTDAELKDPLVRMWVAAVVARVAEKLSTTGRFSQAELSAALAETGLKRLTPQQAMRIMDGINDDRATMNATAAAEWLGKLRAWLDHHRVEAIRNHDPDDDDHPVGRRLLTVLVWEHELEQALQGLDLFVDVLKPVPLLPTD